MFCGECGTKNEKGAAFCSECGSPLEQEEATKKVVKKKVAEPKKETKVKTAKSGKNKVLIIAVLIIAVALGVGYKIGSDLNSPKKIAEDYIDAVLNVDGDKLYKYLEIDGDKTFLSKELFANAMKDSDSDTSDVINYKVTKVDYGEGKLTAKVNFTYTTKDSDSEKSDYVKLIKQKEKKWVIFDSWKVDMNLDGAVVEDYTIKAPKGSEIVFADVKLTDKYLDKDNSTDEEDVYVLPQVFSLNTVMKTKLPSGLELEEKIKPSTYYKEHTASFDKDSMSDDMKDKLISKAKDGLAAIYNGAIEGKDFSEIKSSFEHEGIELDTLEETYKSFASNLESAYNKLKSIKFKDGSLYNIELNDEGNIEMRVSIYYDYTVEYTSYTGETNTHDGSSYTTVTAELAYKDGEYYLVNCDDLATYFSRY